MTSVLREKGRAAGLERGAEEVVQAEPKLRGCCSRRLQTLFTCALMLLDELLGWPAARTGAASGLMLNWLISLFPPGRQEPRKLLKLNLTICQHRVSNGLAVLSWALGCKQSEGALSLARELGAAPGPSIHQMNTPYE